MKETIRVLLVEPQKHPRLVEVEHTLENLQGLVGDWIAASYPWDDPVGLVYGDNSKLRGDTEPNRMLEDYDVLVGPFFLCGLGTEDFASIPDALALKYAKKFWMPERFLMHPDGLMVIREDDGTEPDEALRREADHRSMPEK